MTSPVDKFLSDAVSAARDHADDGVSDGAHTRLRVRESLATNGVARRKRFTLIAAVIASLFGSTAFAYWAGWRPPWTQPVAVTEAHEESEQDQVSMRLPGTQRSAKGSDAIETITSMEKPPAVTTVSDAGLLAEVPPTPAPPPAPVLETESVEPAPARVETKPARTVPRVRARPPAPIEPTPVETTPVETTPVETTPVETKPVETTPRVTNQAPRVEAPKPSAEIAAYRNAHDLHFKGSDPKAALSAWDAYLAKYPDGSLAPEARYTRALVLVKLARWADARAALLPFANGKVAGSYRQKEATEILAAIRDR